MKLRLKERRKELGLRQRDVAERAGLSTSYYTEIELGRKTVNARRLQQIATALETAPRALIADDHDPDLSRLIDLVAELDEGSRKLVLDLAERLAGANRD